MPRENVSHLSERALLSSTALKLDIWEDLVREGVSALGEEGEDANASCFSFSSFETWKTKEIPASGDRVRTMDGCEERKAETLCTQRTLFLILGLLVEAEDDNGLDDSEAKRSIGGHDYHRDCGGITGVWKLPVHHPL